MVCVCRVSVCGVVFGKCGFCLDATCSSGSFVWVGASCFLELNWQLAPRHPNNKDTSIAFTCAPLIF